MFKDRQDEWDAQERPDLRVGAFACHSILYLAATVGQSNLNCAISGGMPDAHDVSASSGKGNDIVLGFRLGEKNVSCLVEQLATDR